MKNKVNIDTIIYLVLIITSSYLFMQGVFYLKREVSLETEGITGQ